MSMYHSFCFFGALARFSPLAQCFRSFFFLDPLERTRRYITSRDRGSSDDPGSSYKATESLPGWLYLALFGGMAIPEKLKQAFAL